jgi:hypothetical protein
MSWSNKNKNEDERSTIRGNVTLFKDPRDAYRFHEEFTHQQQMILLKIFVVWVCYNVLRVLALLYVCPSKYPMEAVQFSKKGAVCWCCFSGIFYIHLHLSVILPSFAWVPGELEGIERNTECVCVCVGERERIESNGTQKRRNKTKCYSQNAVLTKRALSQMYKLYSPRCGIFGLINEADAANQSSNAF